MSSPRSSARAYAASRFRTLRPPLTPLANPIRLLGLLSRLQWLQFTCAFWAWTWDSLDFFAVSLVVEDLAATFDKTTTQITWGITTVLMLRSAGAIIFGIASDRWGRRWPFVVNNLLFVALELGTGFCKTYRQFLACRSLFGIAMGGLFGNVAAQALEDLPNEARGLVSGMFQAGYPFGYMLATAFARALVNTTTHGWRPLFWFSAGPPILFIAFRLCLPETETYQKRVARRAETNKAGVAGSFVKELQVAVRRHWLMMAYMVLLMAGFNFASHGSQDLYPTMLKNQYGFSANAVTVTEVVANLGAMAGGVTVGYTSETLGRRLSIIAMCVVGGALLYPFGFTSSKAVIAAAFFEQFCVQGAWGVVPIHLGELSPGAIRSTVIGTSYQLGNLASSASSTIESTIGARFPLPPAHVDGRLVPRYKYGTVMAIFLACVFGYLILLTIVGPEHRGCSFDADADADLAETTAAMAGGVISDGDEAKEDKPEYNNVEDVADVV